MFDPISIINLTKSLGILDAVRFKLVQQKDPAAVKLSDVLDELAKMVGALDEEIVRYLGLYFGTEESIIRGRIVLLGMEVGQSYIRVNEARGHCHKIANIYDKYLKRWFKEVLNPIEQQELESLFNILTNADNIMIGTMEQLTDWLTGESREALDDISANNLLAVNQRITQARLFVRPACEALTQAMAQMRGLQAEFIAAAGTV